MTTWCLFCAERGVGAVASCTVDEDPACSSCAAREGGAAVPLAPAAAVVRPAPSPERPKRGMPAGFDPKTPERPHRVPRQRTAAACRVSPAEREAILAYAEGTSFMRIARETGASFDHVAKMRKAAGLRGGRPGDAQRATASRSVAPAEREAILAYADGTSFSRIARETGVNYGRVAKIRKAAGLQPGKRGFAAAARGAAARGAATRARVDALLGTMTDTALAARAGVTAARVCQLRGERGIPRFAGTTIGGETEVMTSGVVMGPEMLSPEGRS